VNKLAIFDCDGTLVHSASTIWRALDATFADHGLECPPPRVAQKVIGLSLEEAMAALVADGDHAAMAETYKSKFIALRQGGEVDEPLFDGIVELLDALAGEGWLLGIATGKSLRGLNHCLDSHGLSERFVTLQTADTNLSKPNPAMALAAMAEAGAAPETTVFVGDTAWDMGCARAAGCGAIGVAWGYHEAAELLEVGAHRVAERPDQVLGFAEQWVRQAA
jgi:phosphoglycolate phosphatase